MAIPVLMYLLFGILTAIFMISATVVDVGCITTVISCLVIVVGSLIAWPLVWMTYLLSEST